MTPLELSQSVLTFIGVCAPEENTSIPTRIRIALFYVLLIIMCMFNMAVSSLYFIKYFSIDYNGAVYALLAGTSEIGLIFTLITLRYHSVRLRSIFVTLKTIHEEYINTDAFNESSYSNRIANIVSFIFIKLYVPGFFLISIGVTSLDVLRCFLYDGLTDVKCLESPYKFSLPWNESTFADWFYKFVYSTTFAGEYFILNAYYLSACVIICIQFNSFRAHCEGILLKLKYISKVDSTYDEQVKNILSDVINFSILMKNLYESIADTFDGTIFVQMLGGVICMSTSIFQMEMALRNPNVYLLMVVNCFIVSLANLYLYCFAGTIVTDNCVMLAHNLFESDWYKMPNHLQKYFIIMIAETQRPIYLEGYGIIRLSLECFTKVNLTRVVYPKEILPLCYNFLNGTGLLRLIFWILDIERPLEIMFRAAFSYYIMFKTLSI